MALSSWRAVRTSPARRPAVLAPWLATYVTAAAETVIFRARFPAWITISAVMTFVMLPIGRLVLGSRPHSFWPVPASARYAPSAATPVGAGVVASRLAGVIAAARAAAAALAGAAATTAVRTTPATGSTRRRGDRRMAPKVITGSPSAGRRRGKHPISWAGAATGRAS